MRRELMLEAVPRDESDGPVRHLPDRDRSRGLAPRRVDVEIPDVVEERVEPGSSEDADLDGVRRLERRRGRGAQADFSFLVADVPSFVFFVSEEPDPWTGSLLPESLFPESPLTESLLAESPLPDSPFPPDRDDLESVA
jgi:hypothetical protein